MVSFAYYQNVYHGNAITEAEWSSYEMQAVAQLERYRRMYTVKSPSPDNESMAVCAMAEVMHGFDLLANGEGGPVQSATIGSVSVSYGSAAAQSMDLSPKGQAKELYRCACLYLDIYRGCG